MPARIPNIDLLGRTFSGSVVVIVLIIGLTSWPYLARIVRAEFLSIKEREFILAARATGTPTHQIIFSHILPNCDRSHRRFRHPGGGQCHHPGSLYQLPGLGRQGAHRHLGQYAGRAPTITSKVLYWLWLFPGLLIVLIVLSINFLGDGLRDALDPRSRTV